MAPSCRPPKGQGVRSHTRSAPRGRRKPAKASSLPYKVIDTGNGRTVSRHRTLSAAIRTEKQLDRQAFRAGRGRPYDARKAA